MVVDRFTKFAYSITLTHPFIASRVDGLFMQNVFKLHGLPRSIVSNRDSVFLSSIWKSLFSIQGLSLNFSLAYHPESDGQMEILNRCLDGYLRCYAVDKPSRWA